MKRMGPYILSLLLGMIFSYMLFNNADFNLDNVFKPVGDAKGFQLGVFNNYETAEKLKEKYNNAVIVKDDDVYRVYYSILTNDKVVSKMEKHLIDNDINYYIKTIKIEDEEFAKAIREYEDNMVDASSAVFSSLNDLIMSKYSEE